MKLVKNALTSPIVAISVAIFAIVNARADVLEVGEGKAYSDIAKAVGAANDYDTVLVYDGTYEITAPIHVETPITVKSVNGAAVTTVKNVNSTKTDEGETHRVFFLNNAEAVIEGFTIADGKATRANDTARTEADYGLGVRIDANGGTVSSCIIENCTLGRKCRGGGVYMKSEDAVLTNCIVRANKDSNWSCYAAGVFVTANGLITDCEISGNTVNKSDSNSKWGAGVYSSGGRIVRTLIANNELYNGTEGGAGIYHASGTLIMDNCLVTGNQSQSSKAGGLMIADGSVYVTNCTFTANSSASSAAGIYVASGKAPVFHGCIFADNVSKGTSSGACWPEIDPANATFAYCLCTKELPAAKSVGCAVGNPYFAEDGFTPTLSSDALDLCPPEDYPGLATALDISGNPRLSGEKVDAGCAEYQYAGVAIEIKQPTRRAVVGTDEAFVAKAYVREATKLEYRWTADDGTDSGWSEDPNAALSFVAAGHRMVSLTVRADGVEKDPVTVNYDVAAKDVYVVPPAEGHEPVYPYADKTTAATNIAEALLAAADGSTVHVARGIYLSPVETVVDYGVNLVSEEGAEVTELRIKGWKKGDAGDTPRPLLIDHKDAVVRGFTFSGGTCGSDSKPRTADQYVSPADYGAGVRIGTSGGALIDCVITNCTANRLSYGGGFSMVSADGLISNCVIRANKSAGWKASASVGYMTAGLLTHCTIDANVAGGTTDTKGGLYMTGGRISHCVFTADTGSNGDNIGLAIYQASGTICVDNTLVKGCSCAQGNGAVYVSNDTAYFTNCTFVANSSGKGSSGVTVVSGKKPVFYGCLFANNASSGSSTGDGFPDITPAAATFVNCYSTSDTKKPGCAFGLAAFDTDGFTPTLSSLFIDLCPPEDYAEDVATLMDINDKTRLSGDKVDAGCAEYQYPDVAIDIAVLDERRHLAGTGIPFEAKAKVAGATDIEYRWTSDDGVSTEWSTDPRVDFAFATAGRRQLTLTVRADGVEKGSKTIEVAAAAKDVYVVPATEGHEPAFPYANIDTAATNVADAVLAAADGSTVHVAPGVYCACKETVVDYAMTVVSDAGAESTELRIVSGYKIVDTGDIPRVLLINHPDAVVRGFTLSGGIGGSGYGRQTDAGVSAADYGSGVRIDTNGGTLDSCVITNCLAERLQIGAALGLVSDDAVVTNCVVAFNRTSGWRCCGSIGYLQKGLITHCTFHDNKMGGGTDVYGGLYAMGGRISHCRFENNQDASGNYGAALCTRGDPVAVDNCLFKNNTASVNYGAVYLASNGSGFMNCTFVGNVAVKGGAGVHVVDGMTATFRACLFAGNSSADTTYSDTCFPEVVPGAATFVDCFSAKPLPEGQSEGCRSGETAFAADGYTPTAASAFLDMSDPETYEGGIPDTDLDGAARLSGVAVDAGCAEFQRPDVMIAMAKPSRRVCTGVSARFSAVAEIVGASSYAYKWTTDDGTETAFLPEKDIDLVFTKPGLRTVTLTVRTDVKTYEPVVEAFMVSSPVVFVVPHAPNHVPVFPYDTWATAATNVNDALAAAADGSVVTVTNGVYTSPVETAVTFGIRLQSVEGRDKTELRITGAKPANTGDVCRVLLIDHKDAVVRGFALSGGTNTRPDWVYLTQLDVGAGVYIGANGGTLVDCAVTNNTSAYRNTGGGIAVASPNAVVSNCIVRANKARDWTDRCGGVYLIDGLVTHCRIEKNECAGDYCLGAGVWQKGGRLTHSVIADNWLQGGDGGGGSYMTGGLVDNCLFAGNTSRTGPGGGLNIIGGATALNCTFVGNAATSGGGVRAEGSATLHNCILQDNTRVDGVTADNFVSVGRSEAVGEVWEEVFPSVSYCLCPEALPAGEGNVQATVELSSRFVPKRDSAAVDKGSVDGYEQHLVGGTDLLGKRRIVCGRVDIGCCENQQNGLMLLVR